jgi:hypothetical protein
MEKKSISEEIGHYVTPLALTFLIMADDGWISGSKSVRIATNKFTLQEVELLRDIFKTKFDLDCTIQLLSKEEVIDLRINILFISKWLLCLN